MILSYSLLLTRIYGGVNLQTGPTLPPQRQFDYDSNDYDENDYDAG